MIDAAVVVREYDERDRAGVEEVERACEIGSSGAGKMCLFTDLLGDPLCRIRNSPVSLMLVAETAGDTNGGTEIAGLVRGCVKSIVSAATQACRDPIYTKVGYILGLRVSPRHRRKGAGKQLVDRMEEWFRQMGAEYSYMATEQDNEASVRLFTGRCGYSKFRTPSVLVHPVFGHALEPSRSASIVRLDACEADLLYRRHLAAVEFFPADINAVLSNDLSLGTFLAVPAGTRWDGIEAFLDALPASWAVLSVWNCSDAFHLEVRGGGRDTARGPRRAVARDPVHPQPVRAVRAPLPVRPRRRRTRRAAPRARPLPPRAQPGAPRRVRRRRHRGRLLRPRPRRRAALGAAQRGGPLVHQAARGRLRRRAARRLDQGAGRALHFRRPERALGG